MWEWNFRKFLLLLVILLIVCFVVALNLGWLNLDLTSNEVIKPILSDKNQVKEGVTGIRDEKYEQNKIETDKIQIYVYNPNTTNFEISNKYDKNY